jgi:hypothetical protein
MGKNLPPRSWQRAVEADDYVAVLVLVFAIIVMAAEALSR